MVHFRRVHSLSVSSINLLACIPTTAALKMLTKQSFSELLGIGSIVLDAYSTTAIQDDCQATTELHAQTRRKEPTETTSVRVDSEPKFPQKSAQKHGKQFVPSEFIRNTNTHTHTPLKKPLCSFVIVAPAHQVLYTKFRGAFVRRRAPPSPGHATPHDATRSAVVHRCAPLDGTPRLRLYFASVCPPLPRC